jgi:hypothetical protein
MLSQLSYTPEQNMPKYNVGHHLLVNLTSGRIVLVNVVAEGFWQSCLKHFGRLLRSLSKSLR